MNLFGRVGAAFVLLWVASVAIRAEEPAPQWIEDAACGFKFNAKGLKESPLNSGGTLLTAFLDKQPGPFLEVEYLSRPSGFDAYLEATELGYTAFDAKQREAKDITLAGLKAKWRVYDADAEGPTTIFHACTIPQSDGQYFWSLSGMCSGDDLADCEKKFSAAIKSFALTSSKAAPAKPPATLHSDEVFGFSIDLAGFKGPRTGPENAILQVRSLGSDGPSKGTFAVIASTPFDADIAKHVDQVVKGHERAKRTITSRKDHECSGRKGVMLEYEYQQVGKLTKVVQLLVLERGAAYSVSASWRPGDCAEDEHKPLLDAVKSFSLTRPVKAKAKGGK